MSVVVDVVVSVETGLDVVEVVVAIIVKVVVEAAVIVPVGIVMSVAAGLSIRLVSPGPDSANSALDSPVVEAEVIVGIPGAKEVFGALSFALVGDKVLPVSGTTYVLSLPL